MKLRLKGNSVRIRLSKSEVAKLPIAEYLEEQTCFGNNTLTYALQTKTSSDGLTADFDGNKITLFVPLAFAEDWVDNNVVGIDASLQVTDTDTLHVLLEKDFKCLDETIEDQSDNYLNPYKPVGHE